MECTLTRFAADGVGMLVCQGCHPERPGRAGEVAWRKLHTVQQAHTQSSAPGAPCWGQWPGGSSVDTAWGEQPHKTPMTPAAAGPTAGTGAQVLRPGEWSAPLLSTRQTTSVLLRAPKMVGGWSTCPVPAEGPSFAQPGEETSSGEPSSSSPVSIRRLWEDRQALYDSLWWEENEQQA